MKVYVKYILFFLACNILNNKNTLAFDNEINELKSTKNINSGNLSTVKVTNLLIEGNPIFPEERLQSIIDDNLTEDLTIENLQALTEKLNKLYHDEGYNFAKVYIQKQMVDDDTITLTIYEPKFGEIIINNESSDINTSLIRDILETYIKSGELINVKKIEKAILLANEMAGIKITSDIVQGSEKDIFDIIVKATPTQKIVKGLSGNNYGSNEVGRYNGHGFVQINSPFKRGDVFTLDLSSSDKGMIYGRVGYQLPIGNYGTKVNLGATHVKYKLPEEYFDSLQPEGKANTISAGISQPIITEFNKSVNISTGYDYKKLKNVTTLGTLNNKNINLAKLNVSGKFDNKVLYGGQSNLSLGVAAGQLSFKDDSDRIQDDAGAKAGGQFSKIIYSAEQFQKFNDKFGLYLQVKGQHAFDNLDPVEKISLSGPDGVRGFKTKQGLVDSGTLFKGELLYNIYKNQHADVIMGPFVDYATLKRHKSVWTGWQGLDTNIYNDYSLAGYGAKVNVNLFKNVNLELIQSRPLKAGTKKFVGDNNKNQFWFQIKSIF
ncbi:MAG: ShlB/FhaC/HecB family hemolysin secretion/activation protein [Sphingobacteriia bacterium]|nr:ShlB/FhaC/HecB family hemolysin secretion/activation protein [Sphingobacteriia bacterium]